MLRLTVLIENSAPDHLFAEHGLSLLIWTTKDIPIFWTAAHPASLCATRTFWAST